MRRTIYATRFARPGAWPLYLVACACDAHTTRATGPGEVSKIEGAYADVRFVAKDSVLASRVVQYADDRALRLPLAVLRVRLNRSMVRCARRVCHW